MSQARKSLFIWRGLLLGPDELLELDELLLELEELLEPEELLLDPDELGGLLSELEELLDSEFSLIGFFPLLCFAPKPLAQAGPQERI